MGLGIGDWGLGIGDWGLGTPMAPSTIGGIVVPRRAGLGNEDLGLGIGKTKQASKVQGTGYRVQGTENRELLRAREVSSRSSRSPTPFRQIGRSSDCSDWTVHSHTPGDPTRGSADNII